MKFTVILDPAPEGGYTVVCPALPGCVSEGNDREEALRNIGEAIALWSEVWMETNQKLPVDTPSVVAQELEKSLRERADAGLPLTIETTEVDVELAVRA